MKKALILLSLLSAPLVADQKMGQLTRPMLEKLEQGLFAYYNPHTKTLFHQGKLFHLVTGSAGHLSEKPWISIGSFPRAREVISLDPDNSPTLEESYRRLLHYLEGNARSLQDVLEMASSYIRHEVFSPPLCGDKKVADFIKQWVFQSGRPRTDFTLTTEAELFPVVPLEDFVRAKSGVCRHLALAFAYFFDKLQKESSLAHLLPQGACYLVRDDIPVRGDSGHHAWNLFVSNDQSQIWHVDSTWEVIKNFSTDRAILNRLYSEEVIGREIKRYSLSSL